MYIPGGGGIHVEKFDIFFYFWGRRRGEGVTYIKVKGEGRGNEKTKSFKLN